MGTSMLYAAAGTWSAPVRGVAKTGIGQVEAAQGKTPSDSDQMALITSEEWKAEELPYYRFLFPCGRTIQLGDIGASSVIGKTLKRRKKNNEKCKSTRDTVVDEIIYIYRINLILRK